MACNSVCLVLLFTKALKEGTSAVGIS